MGEILEFPLTKEHLKFVQAERLYREELQRVLDLEFAAGKRHEPKGGIVRAYFKARRQTGWGFPL